MSGMGTQALVTPEGFTISRRVVTSKVRHFAPPLVSAANAASGRANPEAARPAAPVLRKSRRSMYLVSFDGSAAWRALENGIGRRHRVKSDITMNAAFTHR